MTINRKFFVTLLVLFFVLASQTGFTAAKKNSEIDRKRNALIGFILSKQLPALHFSDKVIDNKLAKAIFYLYIKQLDYQKRFLLKSDVEQLRAFTPYLDDNLKNGRIALPDTGFDILSEKIDIVQKMVEKMLANDHVVRTAGTKIKKDVPSFTDYVVKKGDTLKKIVAAHAKLTLSKLIHDNQLVNPDAIHVGQHLKIRSLPSTDDLWRNLKVGNFNIDLHESFETDPKKITFVANLQELKNRWRKILKSQIISKYLDLKEDQEKELVKGKDSKKLKFPDKQVEQKSDEELWQTAIIKIRKRNKNFFMRLHQETLQDHYDRYFNCVTRAFGPHTNYIPPAGKEQFDINMRGSLEGIGALLRENDGFIKVVRIIPGSASALQGRLKAEDVILQVAQKGEEPVDITDMRLRDAVRLIRGPKGEPVTLTVRKADGTKENITIVRDVVQIEETFVKHTVIKSADGRRTGYIFIPSFYRDFEGTRNGAKGRNSTDDTRKAILDLKKQNVDGIVLDLRDDGGGALIDAVDITGLFIKSGPVVQVKNSFGDQRVLRDKDKTVFYAGPLVVLVNQFSASASEIVAAALQDYGRAVVVGTKHTHGKGTVQTILDLNENIPLLRLRKYADLGALKVMIQKFYRITGSSTQYKGVEPDIVLPNLFAHIKSGERYLDYSLPWDSIKGVDFTPWTGTPYNLNYLKKRSLARVAKDEGLRIIKEEAAKAEKRSADTVVSVYFDDMRKKRKEAEIMREKVGAHYRKYRQEPSDGSDSDKIKDKDEDPKVTWLKDVNQDPYIKEAVNIVGDIIHSTGK